MGLIKNSVILLAAVFLLIAGSMLCAQETGTLSEPLQLGAEIQNLEQRLSTPGISPAGRYDALVRLAQLRQLSGNLAIAAAHWLDAAAANPNDDAALVSGAFCLAAIGEWERASLSLQPFIGSGKWGPPMLQARYLDACLRAWTTNNASALAALAGGGDPDFAALRPAIYYTLWQIITRNPETAGAGNAEVWKTRLLAEFPQSPEARCAGPQNQNDLLNISAIQSPLWLLFPGPGLSAIPTAPPAVTIRPVEPPTPPPVSVNTASGSVLQTGLFSIEANARNQSDALQRAGFTASINRKQVNGSEYWAVTVPSGENENQTIADLKKAGFDSFPIR